MSTLHFIYTVPRGNLVHRAWNKFAASGLVPPLYRSGNELLIPWGYPTRAPHSISRNLLKALKTRYAVKFYSMYEHDVCSTQPGDIVLAQPAPALPETPPAQIDKEAITYRTFTERDDITKIIIMPYSHDAAYTRWWSELVRDYGENCIFIAGEHWLSTWELSPFKAFPIKNLMRMDLGIALDEFPVTKETFNSEGNRGVVYVGHTGWYKNIAMLEAVAEALPEVRFAHIGAGKIKGWKQLADFADLDPAFMKALGSEYDLLMCASTGDPQITTVLEFTSAGWPVAYTKECGHSFPQPILLMADDLSHNVKQIREFQTSPEGTLKNMAAHNRAFIRERHNWSKITADVLDFIEKVS